MLMLSYFSEKFLQTRWIQLSFIDDLNRHFASCRNVLCKFHLGKVSFSYRFQKSIFSDLFFSWSPPCVIVGGLSCVVTGSPSIVAVTHSHLHVRRALIMRLKEQFCIIFIHYILNLESKFIFILICGVAVEFCIQYTCL